MILYCLFTFPPGTTTILITSRVLVACDVAREYCNALVFIIFISHMLCTLVLERGMEMYNSGALHSYVSRNGKCTFQVYFVFMFAVTHSKFSLHNRQIHGHNFRFVFNELLH